MSIIDVQGLTRTYRQGASEIRVLDGLSMAMEEGETLAILGQSGSGKSTLLSLLAGLDRPDAGSVRIAGEDLVTMNEARLAAFRGVTLGIVFQQFHLMSHLTALENVSLPLEILGRPEASARSREVLEQVGLAGRSNHFPHQLSGGERQRIAIARAIASRPRLLLADEPSGNLDARTAEPVMHLFFDLVSRLRMTMILVTHNTELAARCHRRLVLENGQLHTH